MHHLPHHYPVPLPRTITLYCYPVPLPSTVTLHRYPELLIGSIDLQGWKLFPWSADPTGYSWFCVMNNMFFLVTMIGWMTSLPRIIGLGVWPSAWQFYLRSARKWPNLGPLQGCWRHRIFQMACAVDPVTYAVVGTFIQREVGFLFWQQPPVSSDLSFFFF